MIDVLLFAAGFVLVGAGFPVDGLPGAALAAGGLACIWTGWFRVTRRNSGGAR